MFRILYAIRTRSAIMLISSLIAGLAAISWFRSFYGTKSQNGEDLVEVNFGTSVIPNPVKIGVAKIGDLVMRTNARELLWASRNVTITAHVAGDVQSILGHDGKFVRKKSLLNSMIVLERERLGLH